MENSEIWVTDIFAWTILRFGHFEVDVMVFVDQAAHNEYIDDADDSTWGSWHPYPYKVDSEGHRKRDQPTLGRLGFVKGQMGVEVVFHEITHMLMFWVDMLGIGYDGYDEYIAKQSGRFAKDFYKWFYKEDLQDE